MDVPDTLQKFPRWHKDDAPKVVGEKGKKQQAAFITRWSSRFKEWCDLYGSEYVDMQLVRAYHWEDDKERYWTPSGRFAALSGWLERNHRGAVNSPGSGGTDKGSGKLRLPPNCTALCEGYRLKSPQGDRVLRFGGYVRSYAPYETDGKCDEYHAYQSPLHRGMAQLPETRLVARKMKAPWEGSLLYMTVPVESAVESHPDFLEDRWPKLKAKLALKRKHWKYIGRGT